jgi:Flp pilus assembly protein TadD
MFLAKELEERGDTDGALLRYRQAVAMEPQNAEAHVAFAKFLLRYNNEDAAVYHLQAAYRLDPRHEWVVDELIARGKLPPLAAESEGAP